MQSFVLKWIVERAGQLFMNLATRNHSAGMGKKATFDEDPCLCRPIKRVFYLLSNHLKFVIMSILSVIILLASFLSF